MAKAKTQTAQPVETVEKPVDTIEVKLDLESALTNGFPLDGQITLRIDAAHIVGYGTTKRYFAATVTVE